MKQQGKSTDCFTVKLAGKVPQSSSENSFSLVFKIESHSDDWDLNDYSSIHSSKYGKELWKFFKEKIESNLSVEGCSPELTLEYWGIEG